MQVIVSNALGEVILVVFDNLVNAIFLVDCSADSRLVAGRILTMSMVVDFAVRSVGVCDSVKTGDANFCSAASGGRLDGLMMSVVA